MRVLVIIPSFRQSHFVREAVLSVAWQTRKADRIVVVAGSLEDLDVARGAGAEAFYVEPKGLSDARNRGIERARDCDAILPLDADDMLAPMALEVFTAQAEPMTMNRWIVGGSMRHFGSEVVSVWHPPPFEQMTQTCCLTYSSLYSRKLWEDLGGYDVEATWAEDWDFWIRAWKMGVEVRQVREPLLLYRSHPGQKTKREHGTETEERRKLLAKHGLVSQ